MAKQKQQLVSTSSSLKPPVVAVLGHVDHGKTTLLDTIRKSRIAAGEAGAITQHIGAYQINHGDRKITFIDTPGHAAFTNLRSRGANVADIALLVIDAVESLKPQTEESIKIIKKAGIPMIVAMNKIDLPHANPAKVGKDLLRVDVQLEEHGGKIASVPISAKTGKGISDLLDTILLVAELKKISASDTDRLQATIIEARKDIGKGNVATIIVRSGTLTAGDTVLVDSRSFRVRALFNDLGKPVKAATPGMPVEVLGFGVVPPVGAVLTRAGEQQIPISQQQTTTSIPVEHTEAILKILLKGDTQGSLEAIQKQLPKDVAVVDVSMGDITESDVAYAKTTDLVIIGFNIRASNDVKKLAADEGVRIRTYRIIYELFEEITEVVEMLKQGPQRKVLGEAKILQEFATSSGKIAGVQVTEGRIARGDKAVVIRHGEEITGPVRITAIREQKEEITKAEKGKLCGVLVSPSIDFRIGDMIQSYTLYEF